MATLHNECNNCEAVFKIRHDMDEKFYNLTYCPFCGCEIDEDQNFDQEDE